MDGKKMGGKKILESVVRVGGGEGVRYWGGCAPWVWGIAVWQTALHRGVRTSEVRNAGFPSVPKVGKADRIFYVMHEPQTLETYVL